jgi:hypothetical protein
MTRVLGCAALTFVLLACSREAEAPASPEPAAATAPPSATAPLPPTTAQDEPPPATIPADHDVTGAYFPMEPWSEEFAELEHLSLANIDENAAPAPLNGFLRPKARAADDYELVNPVLSGTRLTFVTTSHGGVRYEFDGEFAQLAKFPENPPAYETAILTGTLKRVRDGQTVASTPVRFRYEAGG